MNTRDNMEFFYSTRLLKENVMKFNTNVMKNKTIIAMAALLAGSVGFAGIANAQPEVKIVLGSGPTETLSAPTAGNYSFGSGSLGIFSWTSLTVDSNANISSPTQSDLSLSIAGLTSSSGGHSITFNASDVGFSFFNAGHQYLETSGSFTVSGATSGDTVGLVSGGSNTNAYFSTSTGSISPPNSPIWPTATSNVEGYNFNPASILNSGFTVPYSLTAETAFQIDGTGESYGGTFASIVSPNAVVPEPTSLGLMALGGLGLLMNRRKKAVITVPALV
jgi:PEP-CTERM motif